MSSHTCNFKRLRRQSDFVFFFWFNCCAGCFWLTMRDLFCTVDPESYLETSCTSVIVTAMQVEEKKEKLPMLETNLSKVSWQIMCLKRCWVRCINGFPNYPSVRRLLDSCADINISASFSPPSCQHCHI